MRAGVCDRPTLDHRAGIHADTSDSPQVEAAIRRWQAFRQQAGTPNASHAPSNTGQHRHHVHSLVRGKAAPARRVLVQGSGQPQLAQALVQGSGQQQIAQAVAQGSGQQRVAQAAAQGLGQQRLAQTVPQGPGQQRLAQAVAQGLARHQLGLESFQTGPAGPGRLEGVEEGEARGQGSAGRAERLYGIVDRSRGWGSVPGEADGNVDPVGDVAVFRGRPCEGAGLRRWLSKVSVQWPWAGLARGYSRLREGMSHWL